MTKQSETWNSGCTYGLLYAIGAVEAQKDLIDNWIAVKVIIEQLEDELWQQTKRTRPKRDEVNEQLEAEWRALDQLRGRTDAD